MFRKCDWSLFVVVASLAIVFVAFFHRPLFGDYDFIYRDAGRFYLPLFELIHDEWRAGRVPRWNPYENAGTPLLANATASVFYPGKQIFLLPVSFEAKFKAYISLHVVFIAASSFCVAKFWNMSTIAAGLVALSYTFSGMVIFQFCNVVFLCSAGWLPWGLFFGERLLQIVSVGKSVDVKSVVGLSGSLAMMILCGDPQMAYHVGLLLGVRILAMWMTSLPESDLEFMRSSKQPHFGAKDAGRSAGWLLLAAIIAGGIAAVQILPTAEFSRFSVRATSEVPRNIWQIPTYAVSGHQSKPRPDTGKPPHWYDGLVGDAPPPAKHDFQIYSFSFAPIRLIEFLAPNITGSAFNRETRWTQQTGWETENIWMPSVYLGLIPFMLAIVAFAIPCETLRTRWLKAFVCLSLLASFGRYGLVWLMHLVAPPIAEVTTPFQEAVGGLYWALNILLPAYSDFRFPAKWITVTTFGLAMLAGFGMDRLGAPIGRRLFLRCVSVVSILMAVIAMTTAGAAVMSGPVDAATEKSPFDVLGSFAEITRSLVHGFLVLGVVWAMLLWSRRNQKSESEVGRYQTLFTVALLAITLVDMGVANHRLVPVAHRDDWKREPTGSQAIGNYESQHPMQDQSPIRSFRPLWFTPELDATTNAEFEQSRASDVSDDARVFVRERSVLAGGANQGNEIAITYSATTLVMNAYEAFFDPLPLNEELFVVAPRLSLDVWGTKYFLLPNGQNYNDPALSTLGLKSKWPTPAWQPGQPPIPWPIDQPLPTIGSQQEFTIAVNEDRFPHAWIVRNVTVIPEIETQDSATWVPLMQKMILPTTERIDLRTTAVVEHASPDDLELDSRIRTTRVTDGESANESVRVVSYQPDEVVIEATAAEPGLLVVADAFYPGWTATVEHAERGTQPVEVLRTNRMMRGVVLESAGKSTVIFRYRPTSFYVGAIITALTLIGVMVCVIVSRWRKRIQGTPSSPPN